MPTLTLEAIQQRIAQRDSELQTLRRELETRQSRLQSLTQRKQDLEAKLQRVDAEMAAVAAGSRRPVAALPKSTKKKPALQRTAAPKPRQPTLAALIVAILQDTGGALTVQQVTAKVKQRGWASKSKALHKLVGKNVYVLAGKGILRRATDQPGGFVLAMPSSGKSEPGTAKLVADKAAGPNTKPTPARAAASTSPAAKSKPGVKAQQKPLREVLTQILKKMGTPMTGSELAEEALRAGYHTTSKRFVDNIWTMLNHMDNVENVKGQGYRLKRSK